MSEEEDSPTEMIAHYLQKIMHSQEKIAVAEKKKAEAIKDISDIIYGLIIGIGIAVVIVGIGFVVVMFGGQVIGYFYYDVFGNERIAIGATVAYQSPIDDCSYSEDEQLCYQMSRIADALESSQNKTEVIQIDD